MLTGYLETGSCGKICVLSRARLCGERFAYSVLSYLSPDMKQLGLEGTLVLGLME